jgi:hypothetical protein
MPRGPTGEKRPGDAPPSREELLKARADVERQILELSYKPIAGGGGGTASPKPALLRRLNKILAEIGHELADMDNQRSLTRH